MSERRRRRVPAEEPQTGAPAWSLTYGNLVTLLLAFFVMAYAFGAGGGGDVAAATGKAGTVKQLPVASLSAIKRRITTNLDAQHLTDQVRFDTAADGSLVVHLDAKALYDSGSSEIKSPAVLDAVGSVLQDVGNAVRVEGHTDNVPMTPTPQFPDNWALSMARAGGVLRYLHEYHQITSDRLSAVGYADTHPVASNATPEGQARNRRVDIVILGR